MSRNLKPIEALAEFQLRYAARISQRGSSNARNAVRQAIDVGFAAVELLVDGADGIELGNLDVGPELAALAVPPEPARCLTSTHAAHRMSARLRIIEIMEAAARIGCPMIVVQLTDPGGESLPYEDAQRESLEALMRLRFDGERLGISIACYAGRGFLTSPMELREFIDTVNSPWVGAYCELDSHSGIRPRDWIAGLGHRMLGVRIPNGASDRPDSDGVHNAGNCDSEAVLSALGKARFAGPLSVEPMMNENLTDMISRARAWLHHAATG